MGTADPILPAFLLVAIFLIAIAGWAIVHFIVPLFQDKQIPAAGQVLSEDTKAAIAGVSAFYTIDYTEFMELWGERVCATTTEEGCNFVKGYFAAAVHSMAEKYFV